MTSQIPVPLLTLQVSYINNSIDRIHPKGCNIMWNGKKSIFQKAFDAQGLGILGDEQVFCEILQLVFPFYVSSGHRYTFKHICSSPSYKNP